MPPTAILLVALKYYLWAYRIILVYWYKGSISLLSIVKMLFLPVPIYRGVKPLTFEKVLFHKINFNCIQLPSQPIMNM